MIISIPPLPSISASLRHYQGSVHRTACQTMNRLTQLELYNTVHYKYTSKYVYKYSRYFLV